MNKIKNYTTIHLPKLDKCVGGCNTLNELSNIVCVPNES